MIVINELPIILKNYPLLLFASSEGKFRDFLEQVAMAGNSTYIRYAYEIRPQVTREVLTMAGISATLSHEDLAFMAEDIGSELVPFLKPKDLLQAMDSEKQREFISLLNPKEILANISVEELIEDISPEQRKKLFELVLKMLASGLADREELDGKSSNN